MLVEDQMSAIKLSPFIHSAALLSTDLTTSKVDELKINSYQTIWLALDKDATLRALRMQMLYRNELPNLKVVALPRDVKNMNEEELNELLRSVT